jgi:hypothetical protein
MTAGWVRVVEPMRRADAEEHFDHWLREHGLDRQSLDPQDVRFEAWTIRPSPGFVPWGISVSAHLIAGDDDTQT